MLADFFRYWWALVYWNIRKTTFVLRGSKGRAPCQHPSDSGHAIETGCEACQNWCKPERFRRVCPLLIKHPRGWHCAADSKNVRPFWGRAIAPYAAALLAIWLLGTLAAFLIFRQVGYETLRYADFWSPKFFSHLRLAQADHYLRKATTSFAEGDARTGLLALSLSYARNPGDFDSGLLLAQLLQRAHQYTLGDQIYERLTNDFPNRSHQIATAWSGDMLARSDWPELAKLSAREAARANQTTPAWMRLMIFALRKTSAADFDETIAAIRATLPSGWHPFLKAEIWIHSGDIASAREALTAATRARDPAIVIYGIEGLLHIGETSRAARALDNSNAALGPMFFDWLGLRIADLANFPRAADIHFNSLAGFARPTDAAEWLCAEIIRHPEADRFARLIAFIPPERLGNRLDLLAALFAASQAVEDSNASKLIADYAEKKLPGSQNLFEPIRRAFTEKTPAAVRAVIHQQLLPREAAIALIEDFASTKTRTTEKAVSP